METDVEIPSAHNTEEDLETRPKLLSDSVDRGPAEILEKLDVNSEDSQNENEKQGTLVIRARNFDS